MLVEYFSLRSHARRLPNTHSPTKCPFSPVRLRPHAIDVCVLRYGTLMMTLCRPTVNNETTIKIYCANYSWNGNKNNCVVYATTVHVHSVGIIYVSVFGSPLNEMRMRCLSARPARSVCMFSFHFWTHKHNRPDEFVAAILFLSNFRVSQLFRSGRHRFFLFSLHILCHRHRTQPTYYFIETCLLMVPYAIVCRVSNCSWTKSCRKWINCVMFFWWYVLYTEEWRTRNRD